MPLSGGSRLGPYEVVALLGSGGMGEVYRARDTRLDRMVAIKVLKPGDRGADSLERFRREARLLSRLSHPYICALHDIGEQDGITFLVMEYLEGDTLADRLQSATPPLDQALRWAHQVATALAEAHRQGVVHRDLKPANIMLTRVGVKVLDFGLAKLHEPEEGALSEVPTRSFDLTAAGMVMGTVPYMAPEQLEARPTDARTDIFAFGAILYEMVTGKRPFEGGSPASLIASILTAEPEPVSSRCPTAPLLDRLVLRCLAKNPDARWQTAQDLVAELTFMLESGTASAATVPRWRRSRPQGRTPAQRAARRLWPGPSLALAAALAVGLGVAAWLVFHATHRSSLVTQEAQPPLPPLPEKPSIVVLPFDNMSKDPGQDYFSNGITEVLTSDLSRISSLFVIARNTAFTYKGKAVNVQDVRKELGVRYVLEGSVQKAGDQVRIVVQLVDTTTGGHVWSQRYDRPFKDIFVLQDQIVQKIVTTLRLQLTLQEQGYIVRKQTDNLEAYDYYLRGMESSWRITEEANVQARRTFEKALALDPQYAEAYVWLGRTYYLEWSWGWSTDPQKVERAFELVQKAIALDDSLPIAHSLLGMVHALKHQYDQAVAEGERAIALDPNNAESYAWHAHAMNFAGRPEEALRMMEQALRLNPRYPPHYLFRLGWAYRLTGRYAEAVATLKELINRRPTFLPAHDNLALSYAQQWAFQRNPEAETLPQAFEAAQRTLALNDTYSVGHVTLGYVYLLQKQYEQALHEMERVITLNPTLADGYAGLAVVRSCVGRPEESMKMVEQALRRQPFAADNHLDSIGAAYYLAGRPAEALGPLKQYLARYPNNLGAHLTLAAVHIELGKEAEARAEAAEVLRLNPQFSLEVHKARAPIKDPAVLEHHIASLSKAGLNVHADAVSGVR